MRNKADWISASFLFCVFAFTAVIVSKAAYLELPNLAENNQEVVSQNQVVLTPKVQAAPDYAVSDLESMQAESQLKSKKSHPLAITKRTQEKASTQNNGVGVYVGEFKLTGYCSCSACSGGWGTQTASGKPAKAGITVAADKNILPLGTKIYIDGVGERVVQDVGGAIKGNKIDVYVNSHAECYDDNINKKAKVYIMR